MLVFPQPREDYTESGNIIRYDEKFTVDRTSSVKEKEKNVKRKFKGETAKLKIINFSKVSFEIKNESVTRRRS